MSRASRRSATRGEKWSLRPPPTLKPVMVSSLLLESEISILWELQPPRRYGSTGALGTRFSTASAAIWVKSASDVPAGPPKLDTYGRYPSPAWVSVELRPYDPSTPKYLPKPRPSRPP